MTCREVNDRATDYMDRKLSVGGRLAIRAHVARCRDCRAFLHQMRLTVSVLHGLGAEPVSQPARASLLETFRAAEAPETAPVAVESRTRRASARVLSGLDDLLSGGRSLLALAVVILGSLGLAAAVRAQPGAALPLAAGFMCGGMELMAGMLPLGIVAALAWRGRRPSSWAAYAVPAGLGALAGQSLLHFTCPEQGMYIHLGFHVAGVAAAIALGVLASMGQAAWAGRRGLGVRT